MMATGRQRMVPLSYQQQTYWEAEQQRTVGYRLLGGNEHVANTFGAFRVDGHLNLDVLRRTLRVVLRRHESLRMRFETVGGPVMQIVTDADDVPLQCVDVRQRSPVEDAVSDAAARAALSRFDYTGGILLRAHAIQASNEETVVVLSVPHIVSDSVSVQVLINDVLTLYAHGLHGQPSPLPEPDTQYTDFVRSQREWLHRREALQSVEEHVSRRLAGVRPLRLPVCAGASPASADSDADAGEIRFVLDEHLLAGVRALVVRQRVTPFVVMLSAFNVLLAGWSGQADILLLAALAARADARMQKVIGMFSNLCPLRADLSGNPRFTELLEQMQETVLAAMRHRCVPHAVLASLLGERGDIACTGVGVNAVPDGGRVVPRGCSELLGGQTRVSPYVIDTSGIAVRKMRGDLSFWVGFQANGGISGRLMYCRASLDEETVTKAADAFLANVATLAAHPDRHVHEV